MTNLLKPYREKIDALDDKIVDLLAERIGIIHEVAKLKGANDIPAVLPDRVNEVIDRCSDRAGSKKIEADFVRRLYTDIVQYCCQLESKLMKK